MTALVNVELPPLFRCTSETARPLGYHDGISSWTLDVEADPAATRQTFVSHHERAHHTLHSGTPWGAAMLVAGLTDEHGNVSAAAWRSLADACTQTHEAYATFAAVALTPDGLDTLVGNLPYLQHLRRARAIAHPFDDTAVDGAVHLLMHLLMTPRALVHLEPADLRRPEAIETLTRDHAPDERFARLRRALTDPKVGERLRDVLPGGAEAVVDLDTVASTLCGLGIDTPPQQQVNAWTMRTIETLRSIHPDVVAESAANTDRLTSLLDDQQRERVRIHAAPLPLDIVRPDKQGRFPVNRFARLATDLGAHVWLTWLHPDFLQRQFQSGPEPGLGEECTLGLLSCDRTHGPAHASWMPWPTVPPGLAALMIKRRGEPIEPLLFTTLRTLDATADDVDFRGFEPAFILVDSNLLTFLSTTVARGGHVRWSVVGASGDRTIDILALEEQSVPGVVYLLLCSAPTARLVARWMQARTATFTHDPETFTAIRPHLWALTEHLLGTFWIFDLHGWART